MRIRRLTARDFPFLNKLDWSPLVKERDSIYLIISLNHGECSFIAEEKGKWLGVMLNTRSADGKTIYVNHLLVNRKVRRGGIGKKLTKRLEQYALRNCVKAIWLMAFDDLCDYYERLGYKETYAGLPVPVKNYIRQKKKAHVFVKRLN